MLRNEASIRELCQTNIARRADASFLSMTGGGIVAQKNANNFHHPRFL